MDEGLAGLAAGYGFTEPAVALGRAVKGDEVNTGFEVAVPLAMLNRHGLVAGATGTGKTKTVQGLAGRLSDVGVPCFVADMKGDVSGMAEPGEASEKVTARVAQLKAPWDPHPSPVELLTLSGDPAKGCAVRASVSELGALLSKILDLNDVQTSVLSLVFHWADSGGLLLVDLKDLREVLRFLGTDEGQAAVAELGGVAKPTLGVLLRKLVELEEQRWPGCSASPPSMSTTCCAPTPRARCGDAAGAGRRGRPRGVLDLHDVAAGRAVRGPARGGATWNGPSWCSSSTRPTCCSTAPPRRSSTRCSGRCG